MATIDPVIVQIQADISNLKKGLSDAETSLKGLDSGVKKAGGGFDAFGGTLKKVGAVLGTAFAATQIFSFFKDAVKGAAEAEAGLTRLRSILLTTGGATEVQIAALEKQADALSKVGFASKENIIVTQSQLATFDLQGKTINKLTPAILDYVAAEKGATASSEDYKQMTNGLAQALQGNFAALTRVGFVLDEDTKKKISNGTESERAAAITEVLNSTYKDFNKTLAETPEGRMMKLKQEFDDLKQTLGEALLPILTEVMGFMNTTVMPILSKAANGFKTITKNLVGSGSVGEGFKKLKDQLEEFFKPFKEIIKAVAGPDSLSERFQAAGKIIKDFFTPIFKAVGEALKKVRDAFADNKERIISVLNTFKEMASWINKYIIPLFRTYLVTAVKAAGAGISTAIKIIVPVVQFVVNTVKGLINGIITIINTMIKGYNKIAGAFGKEQVNLIGKIGEKTAGVSMQLVKVGQEADKTKKKVKDLGDVFAGSADPAGGGKDAAKTESKIKSLKDKLKGYLDDWKDLKKDAEDKYAEAKEDYLERVDKAEETYRERKREAEERHAEAYEEAQERANEREADLEKAHAKRIAELRKANVIRLLEINKEYDNRDKEAANKLADQKIAIEKAATDKIADLRARAAEREASLLQQSMDRLRSAFASGLGVSLKEEFEKGGGVKGIVDALQEKLTGAKELQKNAAALAGKGYSQTFIEQIVAQGPKVGNEMAKAILEASPETTAEMQNLFGQIETISDSGLDSLAMTMNQGANLATAELRRAYEQVSKDLADSLKDVNEELTAKLAEAQKAYDETVAANAKARQEAINAAMDALQDAIEAADTALKEALAENEADLKKAQEAADKALKKALKDAQDDLDKALIDAQKAFEKAVDAINKAMQKKLDDLLEKIRAVQAALAALGAASAGGFTMPTYIPKSTTPPPSSSSSSSSTTTNNNITIVQNTLTDPTSTATSVISGIKFGNVIVPYVPPRLQGESGAIGAAYMSANTKVITRGGGGSGVMME